MASKGWLFLCIELMIVNTIIIKNIFWIAKQMMHEMSCGFLNRASPIQVHLGVINKGS